MNDEIKEMLDLINELVKISPNKGSYGISHKKWKQLLDYIANLQTIEREYSAILSENAELQHQISLMEEDIRESKEINGELQQENERLKELNENASKVCMAEHKYGVDKAEEARDYKSRCEKAIDMLKELNECIKDMLDIGIDIKNISDIEDVLQNGSEKDDR